MRIREIKGKLEGREKDFWPLRNPGEKEEGKKNQRKGRKGEDPS